MWKGDVEMHPGAGAALHRQGMLLDHTPALRLVEAPPLSAAAADALAEARAEIAANPNAFDGPNLMALSCAADESCVYQASYETCLAQRRLGADGAQIGVGQLGCGVVLYDDEGRSGWSRRSEKVSFPLHLGFAAAGATDLGETLVENVVRETREELGLGADDLLGLRPVWLEARLEPFVLFSAQLRPGAVLRPRRGRGRRGRLHARAALVARLAREHSRHLAVRPGSARRRAQRSLSQQRPGASSGAIRRTASRGGCGPARAQALAGSRFSCWLGAAQLLAAAARQVRPANDRPAGKRFTPERTALAAEDAARLGERGVRVGGEVLAG
jgi:8-oxo-dGTP pyrophosphatase MutT (NUDIX family)